MGTAASLVGWCTGFAPAWRYRGALAATLMASLAIACSSEDSNPTTVRTSTATHALISDATNGGNKHLYFLPPMAPPAERFRRLRPKPLC